MRFLCPLFRHFHIHQKSDCFTITLCVLGDVLGGMHPRNAAKGFHLLARHWLLGAIYRSAKFFAHAERKTFEYYNNCTRKCIRITGFIDALGMVAGDSKKACLMSYSCINTQNYSFKYISRRTATPQQVSPDQLHPQGTDHTAPPSHQASTAS